MGRPRKYSREYVVWQNMKRRCYTPTNPGYEYYGARGITTCIEWRDSFDAFLADMGRCPDGYSIERKNNDLGYFPGNCVWATKTEQQRNTRTTKIRMSDLLDIKRRHLAGETKAQIARSYKVSFPTIFNALKLCT